MTLKLMAREYIRYLVSLPGREVIVMHYSTQEACPRMSALRSWRNINYGMEMHIRIVG